jgi:hypothetical protein
MVVNIEILPLKYFFLKYHMRLWLFAVTLCALVDPIRNKTLFTSIIKK